MSARFCSIIWSSVNSTVPLTSPFVCPLIGEVEVGRTGLSVPFGRGEVGGDLGLGDFGVPFASTLKKKKKKKKIW